MRYPDFFIVGAAKSGTTSLWKYLGLYDQIFMTKEIENKELSYFCFDYGISSLDKYLSFFKDATANQMIGEVCHSYLTSPESPNWIKTQVPNAKIIIILRNPAQRAYSLYKWMIMEGYENQPTFEKALEMEPIRSRNPNFKKGCRTYFRNWFYFETGLYSDQVKRFYDVFGKENTLVLLFEDFKADQRQVMDKIFKHLNLDLKTSREIRSAENASKGVRSVKIQFILRNKLPFLLKRLKVSRKVQKRMQHTLMSLNKKVSITNGLRRDTYESLMKLYAGDIEKLEMITGLNIKDKWI